MLHWDSWSVAIPIATNLESEPGTKSSSFIKGTNCSALVEVEALNRSLNTTLQMGSANTRPLMGDSCNQDALTTTSISYHPLYFLPQLMDNIARGH